MKFLQSSGFLASNEVIENGDGLDLFEQQPTLSMARQRCVRLSFLLSEVPFYRESVVCIVIYKFIKFDGKSPQFCVF